MTEISYQIFDKESGLPIKELSDEFIRSMAFELEVSVSEIFNKIKDNLKIKYFVSQGTKDIEILDQRILVAGPGEYFPKYSDAVKFINE